MFEYRDGKSFRVQLPGTQVQSQFSLMVRPRTAQRDIRLLIQRRLPGNEIILAQFSVLPLPPAHIAAMVCPGLSKDCGLDFQAQRC